jgi:hypothetical protein
MQSPAATSEGRGEENGEESGSALITGGGDGSSLLVVQERLPLFHLALPFLMSGIDLVYDLHQFLFFHTLLLSKTNRILFFRNMMFAGYPGSSGSAVIGRSGARKGSGTLP